MAFSLIYIFGYWIKFLELEIRSVGISSD